MGSKSILVVGKFYTEGFAQHIAENLNEMGHHVLTYEPGRKYKIPKNGFWGLLQKVFSKFAELADSAGFFKKYESQKLVDLIQSNTIDLVLVCHDFLLPEQTKLIKKYCNVPIVLWFPDAVANFRKMMFLNGQYDILYFKDEFLVDVLRLELNKNAKYLPECCNPRYHNHIELTKDDQEKYGCELTTAGNMHAARIEFYKNLLEYDIRLWGPDAPSWMDTSEIERVMQKRFVSNVEKSKCFLASKIVVNNLHPSEVKGTNVRTFEVAATGSFQIVSYRPGIEELYVLDKEIVAFKSLNELKEKIEFYLKNDSLRHQIARAGYERTHSEHTYRHRLNQILKDTQLLEV